MASQLGDIRSGALEAVVFDVGGGVGGWRGDGGGGGAAETDYIGTDYAVGEGEEEGDLVAPSWCRRVVRLR